MHNCRTRRFAHHLLTLDRLVAMFLNLPSLYKLGISLDDLLILISTEVRVVNMKGRTNVFFINLCRLQKKHRGPRKSFPLLS